MAKRLMRISKREKDEIDSDTPILIEDNETDELEEKMPDDVEKLKSEFGGSDYTVSVYRLSDDGSAWERIGSYSVDEFNADNVANKYGGGKFKFNIVKPDGKSAKKWSMKYARPIPVKIDEKNNQDNSRSEIINVMKEQSAKTENLMVAIINAFKDIAVKPQAPVQQNSLAEMIQAVSLLKNMSPEKNPNNEINNMLELFKTGLNLGKEVTGLGAGDGDGGIENVAIKELMKIVIPALSSKLTKPPAQVGSIPKPVVNQAEKGENNMQDRPVYLDETEKSIMLMIEQNKFILINSAKLSADVEPIAEIIVNQIESLDDLIKLQNYFINSVGRIFVFYPNMKNYETWVLALTDKIKFYIADIVKQDNEEKMKDNSVNGVVDENKGGENI